MAARLAKAPGQQSMARPFTMFPKKVAHVYMHPQPFQAQPALVSLKKASSNWHAKLQMLATQAEGSYCNPQARLPSSGRETQACLWGRDASLPVGAV